MAERGTSSAPATGGSSLLATFGILCLTVFALLSLSTVQADLRLSRQSADATAAYYQADCQAEEILALLRAGQTPEGVVRSGSLCTYRCPVSDTQALEVEVELAEDGTYTILRWQTVSTAQWQSDDTLDIWDGQLPDA